MSYTYLLTLTPMGDFFFGGDYTFGADEARGEMSRYRAVSRRFPSQSAVIGALRRAVLVESGCMSLHKKGEWVDSRGKHSDDPNYRKAVRLAGAKPFIYTEPNDLGIFEEISPLYLYDGNTFYMQDAPDRTYKPVLTDEKVDLGPMHAGEGLVFEGFSAKEGLAQKLVDTKGVTCDYAKFFKKHAVVGIKKSRTGQSEEKAFFLKESWRLAEGVCFALTVRTSEPLPFEKTEVFLGADRSMFILKAEKSETHPDFSAAFAPKEVGRLVALSEAFISPEAAKLCLLIVGKRIRQRQIVRQKEKQFEKSAPFFRYEAGTVLYTHRPNEVAELLYRPHMHAVGVNRFLTIPAKGDR